MNVELGSLAVYDGEHWNLSHLQTHAVRHDIGQEQPLVVVIVYSCHCFTRELTDEEKAEPGLVEHIIYDDGHERRVLDPERYYASLKYLPEIVFSLDSRRISIAKQEIENFVTIETVDENGASAWYCVYFRVNKEKKRRLILRIQSAYMRWQEPTKGTKPVRLKTLLKATFEGRKIKP